VEPPFKIDGCRIERERKAAILHNMPYMTDRFYKEIEGKSMPWLCI
jgi:hypothetical protein